ncbi:MAG: hypothetical protein Q8K75_12545 [Chlamydiales bacterium]|nr:hypothetical protein [Chlamydiales bacterium]
MTIKRSSDVSATKVAHKDKPQAANPWSQPASSCKSKSYSDKASTAPNKSDNRCQGSTKNVTRITIKFDVGFSNALYLRGEGPGLSWNKGLKLKNVKADEWVWETSQPFNRGEFKVLINDAQFEAGENHKLVSGANVVYTPNF